MELIPGLSNHLARSCLIRLPYKSLRSILSVSKAWNVEIRSRDFHRLCRLSGQTRPVFVLSQSSLDPSQTTTTSPYVITVFEPESSSFTRLPPGPDLPYVDGHGYLCRVAGVGSTLVVLISGGFDDRAFTNIGVHVFDFPTGQWREGAVMPGPDRVFYGLTSDPVSRMVLVAGGCNGDYTEHMRSALLYDMASDTWKAVGDMANERFSCEVVFVDGRFHAVNGLGLSRERCLAVESLDPDMCPWVPLVEGEVVDAIVGQVIMENGEGDVYRYYLGPGVDDKLEVRRGGEWQRVLDIETRPNVLVSVMMWRDKMLLVEIPEDTRCWAHVLDLKSFGWTKVALPEYFQAVICGLIFGCGMDI